MYIKRVKGPVFVTLGDGRRMSRADLPPPDTSRWVASRKSKVVLAVTAGLIELKEACEMYGLSEEELTDWCLRVESHGEQALKSTNTQKYRQP